MFLFIIASLVVDTAKGTHWGKLGCYKDNIYSRALPFDLGLIDLDYDTTYPNLKKFFHVCRKQAERHGFYYFGIQDSYECWGGYKRNHYDKYGPSKDCGIGDDGYGVGFESANFVYGRVEAVGTTENPGSSCKDIKEKGGLRSKQNWVRVGGKMFQVYCDQSTYGGAWTLVYSYTFTNFHRFRSGSNAVTPRPNWQINGNGRISLTAPSSETDYNALDFHLWKHIGTEFMIKSNINNWIACREGTGSLIKYRTGSIHCRIVRNLTGKCGNVAPNQIQAWTHDRYGRHNLGPNLYDSRVRSRLKIYYYLETSTAGVNWPTHDPCGSNQLNHLRVANPHGNVYVR